MPSIKHLLSVSLFLLLTNVVNGQDYSPGYIVTLDKDTIYGEVDSFISNTCSFKKGGATTKYKPSEIWAYTIENGASYKGGIVDDEFVEILLLGESMSLYKKDEALYVEKQGESIQKLEEIQTIEVENGIETIQKSTRWRGVFSYLISDCSSIDFDPQKTLFVDKEILRLAKDYNECKNSNFIIYRKKYVPKFRLGGIAGYTSTTFKVTDYFRTDPLTGSQNGGRPKHLESGISDGSIHYGLSFIVQISKNVGIQIDAFSSKVSYSDYSESEISFYHIENTASADIKTVSLPTSLVFTLPCDGFSVNLRGGVNLDFISGEALLYVKRINTLNESTLEREEEAFPITKKLTYGGIVGVDVVKHLSKIDIGGGVRYYRNGLFSITDDYAMAMEKISFSVFVLTK